VEDEPLSPLHAAQLPVVVSQVGLVPLHCPELVAEHWPQAPDGWHAGEEEDGHARVADVP
jgi:hypothetical protein